VLNPSINGIDILIQTFLELSLNVVAREHKQSFEVEKEVLVQEVSDDSKADIDWQLVKHGLSVFVVNAHVSVSFPPVVEVIFDTLHPLGVQRKLLVEVSKHSKKPRKQVSFIIFFVEPTVAIQNCDEITHDD
jgi:hypothetical protein